MYYLDFETFSSSVPPFINSRPYQQIPFQYSLHYKASKDSEVEHIEFIADPKGETRISLIIDLLEKTKGEGDIIAYNMSFEKGCLKDMDKAFPKYAEELRERSGRIKDLLDPFHDKKYYHPNMKGSASLKSVLPSLVPELSYNDLEIKEGGTASHVFSLMVNGLFEGDKEQTIKDLLAYCELDTFAMVRILEELENLV